MKTLSATLSRICAASCPAFCMPAKSAASWMRMPSRVNRPRCCSFTWVTFRLSHLYLGRNATECQWDHASQGRPLRQGVTLAKSGLRNRANCCLTFNCQTFKRKLKMTTIDTLLEAARRHCAEDILPNVTAWNEAGTWPRAVSDKAGDLGLTGIYAPQEFGGQGMSLGDGIRVYEELGRGDGAYAFALSMHNICTFAGCGYGTDAFKAAWAHDLTSGRKLANFALTEPQSGSDPMTMYSRATINDDGTWTISGSKAWVSLAGEADIYFTVVKTSDAPGHKDMAMIAIPADAEGLSFGPLYDTPSYRFLPMGEMYMDKVVVSEDNIILPPGQGLQGSLMAIDIARVSIASGCCGLMQTALDVALSYAKNRKMFGGKNLDLDGIQWMLGEVATDLEAARLLYRAAANALGTPEGPVMAAHSKRFVPYAAVKAANTCTQALGGVGLLRSYDMDRLSRLAQMLRIVDGTTEISRVVIGRSLKKRAADLPVPPIPKGFDEAG